MMVLSHLQRTFGRKLLEWHELNPRPLPWKDTDDPYKIWLSEIILQQTQVSQGIPYYNRFIEFFPTVGDLAEATEDEVLKLWQGLGYNSRARNLHQAAISVAEEHNGYFPDTRDELLKLKGVGPYTAAAIASFAFGEAVPVMDTNVIRIVCRILAIEELPGRRAVRDKINGFLEEAMFGHDPAEFNQAIMNFGAMQCKPRDPDCETCPLQDDCQAYKLDLATEIPVKKVRRPRKNRFFHYLVIHDDSGMIMRRRNADDIWKGMYDFPLLENTTDAWMSGNRIAAYASDLLNMSQNTFRLGYDSVHTEVQILSHQKIHCFFYPIFVEDMNPETLDSQDMTYVRNGDEGKYAVPKAIDCYFRVKSIFL